VARQQQWNSSISLPRLEGVVRLLNLTSSCTISFPLQQHETAGSI
jgi:hypothetical protein